jgi:hypothetical protein
MTEVLVVIARYETISLLLFKKEIACHSRRQASPFEEQVSQWQEDSKGSAFVLPSFRGKRSDEKSFD